MRRTGIELEGVLELDRRDRPALGREPALAGERVPVEAPEGGLDLRMRDAGVRRQC
jgi:hypothetical protein